MELVAKTCFLLFGLVVVPPIYSDHLLTRVPIVRLYWDGVGCYIPVSRTAIQEKLDEFVAIGGPKLYMPDTQVLPNLPNGTHPMYIGFGTVTFKDFVESEANNPESTVSTTGIESGVSIPLLALSPTGQPSYSLSVADFYDRNRGVFPKPDIFYEYIPVDEIRIDSENFTIRNGSDSIHIRYNTPLPCEKTTKEVTDEFGSYVDEDYQFSMVQPDFSFCDGYPRKNRFCDIVADIRDAVNHTFPNVCYTWDSKDEGTCASTVDIIQISKGFRDLIPVTDDENFQVLASERYRGDFIASIKYPCVE